MALKNKTYYTYKDVTIVPCNISSIEHRGDCNPYVDGDKLPLFTAPMDTVINEKNFNLFSENGIIPILPRTENITKRVEYTENGLWAAYSLDEFEKYICESALHKSGEEPMKALLDIANGHMEKVLKVSSTAKQKYGADIEIMAGNIANPDTYLLYAKSGIDYCRCGIGAGDGCLSTSNTGVHFPMASLIDEIKAKKDIVESNNSGFNSVPKIVADGGIRNYSDIIKALALGADYVMCGSMFAKMFESAAAKTYDKYGRNRMRVLPSVVTHDLTEEILSDLKDFKVTDGIWTAVTSKGETFELGHVNALFYGMASVEGQIALHGMKVRTSEGLSKLLPVKYTMKGWVENFKDYLCSAMSYAGCQRLDQFRNNTTLIVNSSNAISVVNK